MIEGPFPPTLNTALDKKFMSGALGTVVQEQFGRHTKIVDLDIEHLQRRVIRYTTQLFNSEKEQTANWNILGKVYAQPDSMSYSFEMMQQLWKNGFSPDVKDQINIPKPIQCIPEVRLLLMDEVPGESLRRHIKKMTATQAHIRQFARAIVKLHRCPIDHRESFTVEDQLMTCKPSYQVLAQTYSDLADAINQIVQAARKIDQDSGDRIFTPIHGDIHPGQVHVDNGNLWILDLDQLKYAEPAKDLATVFAFLKRTARKKRLSSYIETLRGVFIEEYFSIMDWEIARRIPLYEALISLKRACKCFRVQDEEGWEDKMKRLVKQGTVCLQSMAESPEKLDIRNVIELYRRSPASI